MHHELFEEMQALAALDPDKTTEAQEERLSMLMELHDTGQAYFEDADWKRYKALKAA